jgi:hypothetical protein
MTLFSLILIGPLSAILQISTCQPGPQQPAGASRQPRPPTAPTAVHVQQQPATTRQTQGYLGPLGDGMQPEPEEQGAAAASRAREVSVYLADVARGVTTGDGGRNSNTKEFRARTPPRGAPGAIEGATTSLRSSEQHESSRQHAGDRDDTADRQPGSFTSPDATTGIGAPGARPVTGVTEALMRLDEVDGTALARKIDEAAFLRTYFRARGAGGTGARRQGTLGTRWRPVGNVLWLVQLFTIVLVTVAVLAACVALKFILVPLTLAYFITFLLAPLIDLFERRPLRICGKRCARRCVRYQRSEARAHLAAVRCCCCRCLPAGWGGGCSLATAADVLLLWKLPHKLAVLAALLLSAAGLLALSGLLMRSGSRFLEQRGALVASLRECDDVTAPHQCHRPHSALPKLENS